VSARLVVVALVALLAGLGAAAAAIALVGGDEGRAPTTTKAFPEEPVSGPPLELSGTDVRSGKKLALSKFAGKPVVVTIWASWCSACARQAGSLRRFVSTHAQTSVLAVDTQEDAEAAQAFLQDKALDLPTIADVDGLLAARLGVRELPTTLFLTPDHRVASMWEGLAALDQLGAGLRAARAG
jgi:thiol-disulfide isomerase/thioredoxin